MKIGGDVVARSRIRSSCEGHKTEISLEEAVNELPYTEVDIERTIEGYDLRVRRDENDGPRALSVSKEALVKLLEVQGANKASCWHRSVQSQLRSGSYLDV